jgi:CRISPR system Cascade subunit CasE
MDAQRHFLHAACSKRQLTLSGSKGDLKAALLAHPDYFGKAGGERLENELTEAIGAADCQWLTNRADKHGFLLKRLQTTGYRWNALPEKGRNAGFSSLDYEGLLTVTNPELFVQALKSGIGPAKAFGCGLMLIRRADLSSANTDT